MGKGGGKGETYCFIRDPEYAWVPAVKVSDNGKTAQVRVPQYDDEQDIICDGGDAARGWEDAEVPLKDYNKGLLPLQNVDGAGHLRPFADMVQLPFLHEVSFSQISECLFSRWNIVTHPLKFSNRLVSCITSSTVTRKDYHTLVLEISSLP